MTTEQEVQTAPAKEAEAAKDPAPPEEKPKSPYHYLSRGYRQVMEVISVDEATRRRTQNFRARKCMLVLPMDQDSLKRTVNGVFSKGMWYVDDRGRYDMYNMGQTTYIEDGTLYIMSEIIEIRNHIANWWVVLLDDDLLAKAPKVRRFKLEDALNPTLIELGKLAPKNETFRSHLKYLFKSTPPVECETWEQIRQWIECDNNAPVLSGNAIRQYGPLSRDDKSRMTQRLNSSIAINVPVKIAINECGNVEYAYHREGRGSYGIPRLWLVSQLSNGNSIHGIMFNIAVDAGADTNVNAAMESAVMEEEYDPQRITYSEYHVEDTGLPSIIVDEAGVISAIKEFVINNYGKKEAEEILARK